MAAVATVFRTDRIPGGQTVFVGTLALDNSYPTGGYTVDISLDEGFDILIAQGKGYTFEWNRAAQKLLIYQGDNANAAAAPGTQVANATDLSAITALPFLAYGA